ncbi:MAG: MFS transporter [Granulosicoccus sp.]|nr:MFS transporter [Granulosicoccus sp.]
MSAYYFLVFLSMGSVLPFYTLWFKSIELSEHQIGVIAASPAIVVVLLTVYIGNLADKARDWRSTIVLCNWVIAVLVSCLAVTQEFHAVFLFWTLSGALLLCMTPVLDAASIRMARQRDIHYHKMRAFGSLGFIVGVLFSGWVFEHLGISRFLWVLIGLAWMRALMSHSLPKFREGIETEKVISEKGFDTTSMLHRRWFLLVLAGCALIHASHSYYYTFGTVLWIEAGLSPSTVSLLWAWGVVVETLIMWVFASLAGKFSARKLLAVAGLTASVRWMIFGLDPGFSVLVMVQTLHGVTFALLFLATVNFIANWTPVTIAAQAQSFSSAMNVGSMALMTLVSGYVHVSLGMSGYWIMLVICVVGVGLILLGMQTGQGMPEQRPKPVV